MFSRRPGHRFNRGRIPRGGGTPNPVQPGVLTVDDAAPQEGGAILLTVDLTAAELADGFTTTDAVFVLNGVDQGSGTDNMDGTWEFAVDPVTLANANGTWRVRRECTEGNRLSNAVVVDVDEVTATLTPSSTTPTEGDDVTFTAAVAYGTITEARFYDTEDQLAETVTEAPWEHVHADITPGSHAGWRVELDVTEAGARVIEAESATVVASAEAPTLDAPTDAFEITEGSTSETVTASGTVDGFATNTVSMSFQASVNSGAYSEIATDSSDPYSQTYNPTSLGWEDGDTIDIKAVRTYTLAQGGTATIDSAVASGSVTSVSAPAKPTLTAPAAATEIIGANLTLSATTTDGDLDEMQWVLDPGGSETVVATDSSSPYSQVWAVAGALGAHTIVARAVRGALSTDSDPVALTFANPTLVVDTLLDASGTWTSPAAFVGPDGATRLQAQVSAWGSGGGGATNTGAGGGGAWGRKLLTLAASTGYAYTRGAVGIDTDGGDWSFNSGALLIKGGRSRTNGGAGGAASSCVADQAYDGGAGAAGTGNQNAGASAGDGGAASGTTAGGSNGAFGGIGNPSNFPGVGGRSTSSSANPGIVGYGQVRYYGAAPAGFPRVLARSWGRDSGGVTTRDIVLPGGTGGRLLLFVASDGVPAITMTGWTALAQINQSTSQVSGRFFHRQADGSDPVAIATDVGEAVAWVCWRVVGPSGGVPGAPTWSTSEGASTNPDPPSHTPAAGSDSYLWLACMGADGSVTGLGFTGQPTGYGNLIVVPETFGAGAKAFTAEKFATASSDDPGSFGTTESDQWIAGTVAIPPA